MNDQDSEYKDLYDQSGQITLNDIIVILCSILLLVSLISLIVGFRDELRIVAKRCALCCGLNNRCRQYRLRLQMAWALLKGEDLEVARIKQAALAESESRKKTKRIDYEIYNPHTERVVDPQLPHFVLQEQKQRAGIQDGDIEEEPPKIHKRGMSEAATSVAETIATHRRLISAKTEKYPQSSGRDLESISDGDEDVGYEDDEEEEEENQYDDEVMNTHKKHEQQPKVIFDRNPQDLGIKHRNNSDNQNVIIRKQYNKNDKINQRKSKIQKLLEMQQLNLGIEDQEKLKDLQREHVIQMEMQKSEKSKVYHHPLAKNKMQQKGFLNFNSFQKSLAENDMDVDSADKVKAYQHPTISQVFSHISKNNSDFMVPEDFKLASYHKDFSIRDKNFSNLLEVVETPRGDTVIDANFFYNEENFFKYDEVTNAKKAEAKKLQKGAALPPLDKKKRKSKSAQRKAKQQNQDVEKQ